MQVGQDTSDMCCSISCKNLVYHKRWVVNIIIITEINLKERLKIEHIVYDLNGFFLAGDYSGSIVKISKNGPNMASWDYSVTVYIISDRQNMI